MNWEEASVYYIFAILKEKKEFSDYRSLHPSAFPVLSFIRNYTSKYKELPTELHLKQQFGLTCPGYLPSQEIVDVIKTEHFKYNTLSLISELQSILTTDADRDKIMGRVSRFQSSILPDNSEIIKLSDANAVLSYYLSGSEGKPVCQFGYPSIDRATGGIFSQQYIIFYASTSEGKSTFARAVAGNIAAQGKTVLYITLEESAKKSVVKTLSTLNHFNSREVIRNEVSPTLYQKLYSLQPIAGDIIFVDNMENRTVSGIESLVREYKPDIIFLDQIPLFTPKFDQDWKVVSNVSRSLKNYCQISKIPMVALTQQTRKGNKSSSEMDDMAFAYAMAQDGDTVLHLGPTKMEGDLHTKTITLKKVRDDERGDQIEFGWELKHGIIMEKNDYARFLNRTV